ncbi:MAG: UDP-4-amino-4,6-dideoxy-N-acetyl-beta-L-altrosamine transaminase [Patescibacteria group bacterium]
MSNTLSYGKQHIDDDDVAAVINTLRSDYLTQGPRVTEFEESIRQLTGARYCVAVANGTAALHLAVAALELPAGSEGITTPMTFVASANALVYNNLLPRFADIDLMTGCIDPAAIKKAITPRTKMVIPVHYAGQPADMESIKTIADQHNLKIIEDAAHAIGSYYADGTPVGSGRYADLTTFSFHPVKTITTAEGGAITTNDDVLYQRLLLLRTHGITKSPEYLSQNPGPWYYEMQTLGFNYRLSDLHAALGISQMKKLPNFIRRRRDIVTEYNKAFAELSYVSIPVERKGIISAFHLYTLRIDFQVLKTTRAIVMRRLADQGIGTQVHYIPVHMQPYYQKNFGYHLGDFPIAEDFYEQELSLPLYPDLTNTDVTRVITAIKSLSAN